ncbi:MAG: tetratricopeptide repeat protein [Bdellovibrionales bacterium]|nr:tetratricopeptide repeat protein [Bdellovibrionales bacterium]
MKQFLAILILLVSALGWSQLEEAPFDEGIKAYNNKDYVKAQELFSALVKEHPENPSLLFNLGLAEYHLGSKGLALGLWRKARFLDPNHPGLSTAIDFAEAEMFPGQPEDSVFATLDHWLRALPMDGWFFLSFLLFTVLGWQTVTYFAKRKLPLTQWPYWYYSLIPLWLFCLGFSFWLYLDAKVIRATIVGSEVFSHSGPSASSPTFSELDEGLLVTVKRRQDDWALIESPTGSPGWVSVNELVIMERL